MSSPRLEDDGVHALLEAPSVTYTSTAVQRAFVVWTLLGHANSFRDVADYYRRLETVEESFTPEQQKESRNYEYSLLTAQPPTSECLLEHFPRLYPTNKVQYLYPDEMKKGSGFKVQGFNETEERNGATTEEIVETSQLIRKYCKSRHLNIREFLTEFQIYAKKCGVNPTVSNVAFYIKHRNVQEERQLSANYYGYDLRFLNSPPTDNYKDMDLLLQYNSATRKQQMNENVRMPVNVQNDGQNTTNGNAINAQNGYVKMPPSSGKLNQSNDELPLAIKQAKAIFYNNAAVVLKSEENKQVNDLNTTKNTSECGIDDVLNKITDLNHEYGKEINNNDQILVETKTKTIEDEHKMSMISEDKNLDKKSLDIFDHQHLLNINKVEKENKTNLQNDNLVFAKKNKNQVMPNVVPLKKPSYCMKLKVKSKRSKTLVKKSKQIKDFPIHHDSFKSCELNGSFNLIDLDSSKERMYNFSNDFERINEHRCSTSSR